MPWEITYRAYTPISGRMPQVIWEMEFETMAKRDEFHQKWQPSSDWSEKWDQYVDHLDVRYLRLVE